MSLFTYSRLYSMFHNFDIFSCLSVFFHESKNVPFAQKMTLHPQARNETGIVFDK